MLKPHHQLLDAAGRTPAAARLELVAGAKGSNSWYLVKSGRLASAINRSSSLRSVASRLSARSVSLLPLNIADLDLHAAVDCTTSIGRSRGTSPANVS
jgi:hypothetical protein